MDKNPTHVLAIAEYDSDKYKVIYKPQHKMTKSDIIRNVETVMTSDKFIDRQILMSFISNGLTINNINCKNNGRSIIFAKIDMEKVKKTVNGCKMTIFDNTGNNEADKVVNRLADREVSYHKLLSEHTKYDNISKTMETENTKLINMVNDIVNDKNTKLIKTVDDTINDNNSKLIKTVDDKFNDINSSLAIIMTALSIPIK